MSTIVSLPDQSMAKLPAESYLNQEYGLKRWLPTGDNSWHATGLEWQIQSPPLTENFSEIPIMDHEAYDYEWLAKKTQHEVQTVG